MQTGNFIEGSLDIITAAIAPAPGHPHCLSALMASGNRCLQVGTHAASHAFRALSQCFQHSIFLQTPCEFNPLLFLLHTCNSFAITSISSSAISLPTITLNPTSFTSAPLPFASLEQAHAALRHLSQHACTAFLQALSFVHIFKACQHLPFIPPSFSSIILHASSVTRHTSHNRFSHHQASLQPTLFLLAPPIVPSTCPFTSPPQRASRHAAALSPQLLPTT